MRGGEESAAECEGGGGKKKVWCSNVPCAASRGEKPEGEEEK